MKERNLTSEWEQCGILNTYRRSLSLSSSRVEFYHKVRLSLPRGLVLRTALLPIPYVSQSAVGMVRPTTGTHASQIILFVDGSGLIQVVITPGYAVNRDRATEMA
jgi:hypothetical protein